MEVKSNGKVVGTFIDFADDLDYIVVSTKNGNKKFKASECSIVCDKERRHGCTSKSETRSIMVGMSDLQKTSLVL